MLNIFKNSPLKTSILDDFTFYEERERIMQEEMAKLLGRSYDALQFLPAVVPVNRTGGTISQLPNVDGKQANDTVNDPSKAAEKQQCEASDQLPKPDGKQPNGSVNQPAQDGKPSIGIIEHSVKSSEKPPNGAVQPTKADGELPIFAVDQPAKADRNPSMPKDLKATGKEDPSDEQVTSKTDSMRLSNDKKYAKPDPTAEASGATSAMKIGSLAVDSEDTEASLSGDIVTESTPIDVVTVGSMRIKVKGLGESSSSIITVGTIPIEPGKLNKQGALVGSCPHQK